MLEYCKQQGILVQAYGSLFFGKQDIWRARIFRAPSVDPSSKPSNLSLNLVAVVVVVVVVVVVALLLR